jgi:hypothetical protein
VTAHFCFVELSALQVCDFNLSKIIDMDTTSTGTMANANPRWLVSHNKTGCIAAAASAGPAAFWDVLAATVAFLTC